jgi:hypothetical protein
MWGDWFMRVVLGTVLLVLAATPAFAVTAVGPAPLLGLGIPALGAVGGAILGSKLFKRK